MSKTVVEFAVPFPNKREAEVVYDVLRIDAEPRKNLVEKIITLEDQTLKVKISSDEARVARVVVNAVFEAIILSTETINLFGPVTSNSYDHYLPA